MSYKCFGKYGKKLVAVLIKRNSIAVAQSAYYPTMIDRLSGLSRKKNLTSQKTSARKTSDYIDSAITIHNN